MDYKYKLRILFLRLTVEEAREKKAEIIKRCNIHPKTLERWSDIKLNEHSDIPTEMLDKIATVLECKADDLKNYNHGIKLQA